jgi:mannose-6-phosphate isomerase-like protein (cupin superfamily)
MPISDVSKHEWEEWRPGTWSRMWTSQMNGAEHARTGEQWHAPTIGAPNHWHPYEEHLLFTEGTVEVFLDGETTVMQSPFSVIIPPKVHHGFTNVGGSPAHLIVAVSAPIHETNYLDDPGVVTKEYEVEKEGIRHREELASE